MSNTLTTKPLGRGYPKGLVGAVIAPLLAASSHVTRGQATTKEASRMSTLFQAARYIGAIFVMLIFPLWMATEAAAHDCDPGPEFQGTNVIPIDITVPEDGTVIYTVEGTLTADFDVDTEPDPTVATITPDFLRTIKKGAFEIAGVSEGQTTIVITWKGVPPDRDELEGTCTLNVVVVNIASTLQNILNTLIDAVVDESNALDIIKGSKPLTDASLLAAIDLVDASIIRLSTNLSDLQTIFRSIPPGSGQTNVTTELQQVFLFISEALALDYRAKLDLLILRISDDPILLKNTFRKPAVQGLRNALSKKRGGARFLQRALSGE